jgi:hypothetical protein
MSHFAELDSNNLVLRVIVVSNNELLDENGNESEQKGIQFCQSSFGGNWIQTSYNGKIRRNFAGIGYKYDLQKDVFVAPQPYPSWVFDEQTGIWSAPIPKPEDGGYYWHEPSVSWVKFPT